MSMCLLSYLESKNYHVLKITMLPSNGRLRQPSQEFASLLPSKCGEEADTCQQFVPRNTPRGVKRQRCIYLEIRFNIIEVFQILFKQSFPLCVQVNSSNFKQTSKETMDLLISKLSFQMLWLSWSSALGDVRSFYCGRVQILPATLEGTTFTEMCCKSTTCPKPCRLAPIRTHLKSNRTCAK